MTMAFPQKSSRTFRSGLFAAGTPGRRAAVVAGVAALAMAGVAGTSRLIAQIEGDRGIAPVMTSQDIEVSGIDVDVTGKTGADARLAGWKEAEKLAWKKIGGPDMPIELIDAMVASIVIEREQVGPHRYIARLGVIFDKAKSGGIISAGGTITRSAPMLTIPVLYSGGVAQVYEVRGPWQRAWAEYQDAQSPIDYVRPSGSGGELLILTAGQVGRHSRLWWRNMLDQFEASDVLIPVARLERQWPGGPVMGTFTARYGPDNRFLGSFKLKAANEQDLPRMLNDAVLRIDQLYRGALAQGLLTPDPTLTAGQAIYDGAFAELREKLMPKASDMPATPQTGPQITLDQTVLGEAADVSVQFATPDAAAVDAALAAVRGVPGVRGAATVSLAIGGTSVMRVSVVGGAERLGSALKAQGWNVSGGGATLRISR